MILNADNYFSTEAQKYYMSASQLKAFMKCEAAALAEINGEYTREKSVSLLVGSYIDAYFEGKLELFCNVNPEIFTQTGKLKAEYKQAEQIISRIERDGLFMKYMSGQKQVIRTGEIDGVPFKIKIDSYHPKHMIVDLKIMRDFEPVYVKEQGRLNFIEAWGYDIQGAVYQAIEGDNLPFVIAAATKEKEPDIGLFEIGQPELDLALDIARENLIRYDSIKKGLIEPERCGKCDYCKKTKILDRVKNMEELDYE